MAAGAFSSYIGDVRKDAMKRLHLTLACGAVLGVVLALGAFGAFSPAEAQPQGAKQAAAKTPDNFSYDIVNGKRVPKAKRMTAADGSWREEVRDNGCVTIKTMSAAGEYRETRKCD